MNISRKCIFFWTVLCLTGIIIGVICIYSPLDSLKNQWEIYAEVTPELLQQVQKEKKKLVIIVGRHDCQLCTWILTEIEKDKETLQWLKDQTYVCYIDMLNGKHQQSIGNSLFQIGQPATYIFNSELRLFSHLRGSPGDYTAQLRQILETSYFSHLRDYSQIKSGVKESMPIHYENIQKENVKEMLENSFLANIYLNSDPEKALRYAEQSIKHGSFFYNNYIAYQCLLSLNKPDQAEIYKEQALSFQSKMDWILFEDTFLELGIPMPASYSKYKEDVEKEYKLLRESLKK